MRDKMRRILRVGVAETLHYTGMLKVPRVLCRRVTRRAEVCVLGFHRVLTEREERQSNSLWGIVLREATFAKIMEYLKENYRVVTLDYFLNGLSENNAGDKPLCLLTFDDGWKDNYSTAYPLLKRFGLPATIFLTTAYVGGNRTFWVERLLEAWSDPSRREMIKRRLSSVPENPDGQDNLETVIEWLKHMPEKSRQATLEQINPSGGIGANEGDQMLNWEEVAEMSRGGVDFGAHTVTHVLLPYENDSTVKTELGLAKQVLEGKLEKPVKAFAYPNGEWDNRVRRMVKEAGYECAFTTQRGWFRRGEDLYSIRRILLHEGCVTGLKGEFSAAMLDFRLSGWR